MTTKIINFLKQAFYLQNKAVEKTQVVEYTKKTRKPRKIKNTGQIDPFLRADNPATDPKSQKKRIKVLNK
jgi:hypothetical protein